MRIWIAAVLLFACQVAIGNGQQETRSSGIKWLDENQYCTIEVPSAKHLIEDFSKTDFFGHSRWEELVGFLTHEKFGLLSKLDWQSVLEMRDAFQNDVRPENIVFSVGSPDGSSNWQLIIRSGAKRPAEACHAILCSLQKLGTQNDAEKQEINPDPAKDPMPQPPVPDERVQTYSFPKSGVPTLYVFVTEEWIVFSGDATGAERILRRIQGVGTDFRDLRSSRVYQSVNSVLSLRGSAKTSLIVHLDPILVWNLAEMGDEQQFRAWGINELAGVGVALNLMPSMTLDDRMDIVASAFVKSTYPRQGISDAIRLKGMPKRLPPTLENIELFAMANMDWGFFEREKQRMFDATHKQGSYAKNWMGEDQTYNSLGYSWREEINEVQGSTQGLCCHMDGEKFRVSRFKSVSNIDTQIELMHRLSAARRELNKSFGYDQEVFAGYPVLLTDKSMTPTRLGLLYRDDFEIGGHESILRRMAELPESDSVPSEVEKMIRVLRRQAQFDSEISIVAAIWPRAWETIASSAAVVALNRAAAMQLKKMTKTEFEQYRSENAARRRELYSFQLVDPQSKRDCIQNIRLCIMKIVADSFGKLILIGGDNGNGLELAAMSIPDDSTKIESSR